MGRHRRAVPVHARRGAPVRGHAGPVAAVHRPPEYGSLGYDGYGGWNILQARYALCLLFEYAATLGIVDVAYVPPAGARPDFHDMSGTDDLEYLSRYDGLTFIRLTPLGAYILGCAESYEPPAREQRTVFTLLTNLDVVATGEGLTFADRIVLERYAQRTADRVWRLDRDMLLAVAEQSESMADVRAFLTARTAMPLPPALISLLDDVADRAQRFVDRGAMRVIDCADPALVLRLANDRATRALVHRRRREPAARTRRLGAGVQARCPQARVRGAGRRPAARGVGRFHHDGYIAVVLVMGLATLGVRGSGEPVRSGAESRRRFPCAD